MAFSSQAVAAPRESGQAPNPRAADVAAYWTAAKRAEAIPRDITVDSSGRSFIGSGTHLRPYGSGARVPTPTLVADAPQQRAGGPKGGGGGDTTPPSIANLDPSGGILTTSSVTFSAVVTDEVGGSGIKSVRFVITYPDGRTQSFTPGGSSDTWSITLNNFTNGDWTWQVVAKDNGSRGGNTATSAVVPFTIALGGPPPPLPPDGVVSNGQWDDETTTVTNASGRLLFEMPANKRGNRWQAYVCSATAVSDGDTTPGVSVILTAAHCVYDEANGSFARNVMFIPDQQWSGTTTDANCGNDKIGCWIPSAGVVDQDWTTRAWPDNIPWDYGYYVVPNSGSHVPGQSSADDALEAAVTTMDISFIAPTAGGAAAFGYSYSEDPKLMYCQETRGSLSNNWWLSQCGLTGGASGGPWLDESVATGTGTIVSVNSWGYSNSLGMAGPRLDGSASTYRERRPECVYLEAVNLASNKANLIVSSAC